MSNGFDWPVLSWLIFAPMVLGGIIAFLPHPRPIAKNLGVLLSLVSAGVLSYLAWAYVGLSANATEAFFFVERVNWIAPLGVEYHVGADGVALALMLLTAVMTALVIFNVNERIRLSQRYIGAFLLLQGLLMGVFVALDGILFYVFWEAVLVPMFIIIGVWGGQHRMYASLKFFLYTFLGSVLMLAAFIYIGAQFSGVSGRFAIEHFYTQPLSLVAQSWIFFGLFLAFAVKVPMWPVHTWLPDAHVQAPTGGSVMLAAVLLKMGGYGFSRWGLPIVPDAAAIWAPLVIGLSLVAVIYIGLVALAQTDLKKLIAYSSIAHMGFVTLGLFLVFGLQAEKDMALMATQGAMVQMISHGLISGALFFCIGMLYERTHTRDIANIQGVANTMPALALMMVFFAMANSGLPGTSGFVGEFFVVVASFHYSLWIALLAGATLVLGAAYSLWMVKRVVWGEVVSDMVAALTDLYWHERLVLMLLVLATLLIGVWPQPLLTLLTPGIEHWLQWVDMSKLPVIYGGIQ